MISQVFQISRLYGLDRHEKKWVVICYLEAAKRNTMNMDDLTFKFIDYLREKGYVEPASKMSSSEEKKLFVREKNNMRTAITEYAKQKLVGYKNKSSVVSRVVLRNNKTTKYVIPELKKRFGELKDVSI